MRRILQALIRRDYRLRALCKRPDKVYWADMLYIRLYGLDDGFYSKIWKV